MLHTVRFELHVKLGIYSVIISNNPNHEALSFSPLMLYTRAGEPFWGRVPKLSINFEEILTRAHGNVDEQNEVLQSSKIINYCVIIIITIVIINAYYYIVLLTE